MCERKVYKDNSFCQIHSILSKLNSKSKDIIVLGSGGAGTVVYDKKCPDLAFKIGHAKINKCGLWSIEYKYYVDICKNKPQTTFSHAKLISINDFEMFDNGCIMSMERVINPIDANATYTIQANFGQETVDYKHEQRGRFLGIKELREIIKAPLEPYVYDLGRLLSSIIFVGMNDCYDIEVFLGSGDVRSTAFGDKNSHMLYVADFDLSLPIKKFDKKTIERIVWALQAVPYFPIQEVDKKLYNSFEKGFIDIAKTTEYLNEALLILKMYNE